MHNPQVKLKQFFLLIGDFFVFQLALPIMLLVRYKHLTAHDYNLHFIPFLIVSFLWLLGFYVAGLYDLRLANEKLKFLRTYFEGVLANLLISFGFFYLLPVFGIAPRVNLFLYVVSILLLDYLWRILFNSLIAKSLLKTKILYIGRVSDAVELVKITDFFMPVFNFKAVIGVDELRNENDVLNDDKNIINDLGVEHYLNIDDLLVIIKKYDIDLLVIDYSLKDSIHWHDILYKSIFHSVSLLDRPSFEELVTSRVPIEHISRYWFLTHINENEKQIFESIKRVIDLFLSVPMALVVIVLYPIIALLIKLDSKGPVLYSQIRVGLRGREFRIFKFRTMKSDAEKNNQPQFAQKNDVRVTRVGRFLRRTRLDELPQVWNVLKGDMSLIGPRPERPEFVEQLTEKMPYYALRHLTRPGLSGWAQVQYIYASNFEDNLKKLQYDLYYIKHRNLVLDLAIILKTIRIILKRMGT